MIKEAQALISCKYYCAGNSKQAQTKIAYQKRYKSQASWRIKIENKETGILS